MFTLAAALALTLAPLAPQARPAEPRLIVTVADESGAVIPGATVTLIAQDEGAKAIATRVTSDKGLATFEKLALGRVTVRAEFSGFATAETKDLRLRAGDTRHTLTLSIKKVEDNVTITQDARVAAADPKNARGTTLTRAEILALPDDPADLAQQLIDMAGGNAVIKTSPYYLQPTAVSNPRKIDFGMTISF